MCWHHQSVWPKLHRHSNITSNHCSSFQTTLNSLVWSLWSNLSKRCLIGALRAVWRAHTPHLSQHYSLVISQEKEKGGFPACGDNEMWSQAWTMQCLPCVLTIWPVIIVRDNHSQLSLSSGHTTTSCSCQISPNSPRDSEFCTLSIFLVQLNC